MHKVGIIVAMIANPVMAKESFHSFKAETIERKKIDFKQFKGKVLLVANIASKCGYTPQLKGLQTLHAKYKNAAFEVIGFPSNDFNQEPLDGVKIGEFCKRNYGVDFTIFMKVHVKGKDIDPIYKYLTNHSPKKSGVNWNFEKFLVDASGNVIKHYPSSTKPNDPSVLKEIDKLVKAGS